MVGKPVSQVVPLLLTVHPPYQVRSEVVIERQSRFFYIYPSAQMIPMMSDRSFWSPLSYWPRSGTGTRTVLFLFSSHEGNVTRLHHFRKHPIGIGCWVVGQIFSYLLDFVQNRCPVSLTQTFECKCRILVSLHSRSVELRTIRKQHRIEFFQVSIVLIVRDRERAIDLVSGA